MHDAPPLHAAMVKPSWKKLPIRANMAGHPLALSAEIVFERSPAFEDVNALSTCKPSMATNIQGTYRGALVGMAHGGHHANAAILHLTGAPEHKGIDISVGGEASKVPES